MTQNNMDRLLSNFKTFALENSSTSNLNQTWSHMENTYSSVLEVLTKATSQKACDIKPAEQQLAIWEAQPGFYNVLLTVYLDQNVPTNVRWLAVMLCKNGIEKYWRLSAPNSLSQEERDIFRNRLLNNLGEPNYQLAVQHAVLVAKVARYDYPKMWPDVISILIQSAQCLRTSTNALLVLHHLTKALCTKRLVGDRQIFIQLVRDIFGILLNIWITNANAFFSHYSSSALTEAFAALEKAWLALKILRKLIYGYKDPHLSPEPVQLVHYLFEQIKPMLDCRNMQSDENEQLKKLIEKNLILILKILHEFLEFHQVSFIQFITPTLQLCTSICFTPQGEAYQFQRFTIMALNLIKAILLCIEYKKNITFNARWLRRKDLGQELNNDESEYVISRRRGRCYEQDNATRENELKKGQNMIQEFFTKELLCQIFNTLLNRYFLLTQEDFVQWEQDPEIYAGAQFFCDPLDPFLSTMTKAVEQTGESWKFSLRPCAESLFLTFFKEFKDIFKPLILEHLRVVQTQNHCKNFQELLLKEAVYTAVGIASFELYDEIDFDNWFTSTLINEIQEKDPNLKFIKRRVIWMVGMWVGVKFHPDNRRLLYGALIPQMDAGEDTVVQLAAVNTLKLALDEFEFSLEHFVPFLKEFVKRINWLLLNLSESDSKFIVLNCLKMLLSRVGPEIQPHAHFIIDYFPTLWESCGDNTMLHCSLLANLVQLVEAMGDTNEKILGLAGPLIRIATDPNHSSCVYLLEEGLDLWKVTLWHVKNPSQPLLDLVSNLFLLLDAYPEHFSKYTKIFLASCVFMPEEFQKLYASRMADALYNVMSDLMPDDLECLVKLVKNVQLLYHHESFELLRPILIKLTGSLLECQQCRTHLPVYLQSSYLVALCQVFFQSQGNFRVLIQETGNQYHQLPDQVLEKLLRLLLDILPISSPARAQKSMVLLLVALLIEPSPVINYLINGIMIGIVEGLNDIMKPDDDTRALYDMLVVTAEDIAEANYDSEFECRIQKLTLKDPTCWLELKEILNKQLHLLAESGRLSELMSGLDAETTDQLKPYLQPSLLL